MFWVKHITADDKAGATHTVTIPQTGKIHSLFMNGKKVSPERAKELFRLMRVNFNPGDRIV